MQAARCVLNVLYQIYCDLPEHVLYCTSTLALLPAYVCVAFFGHHFAHNAELVHELVQSHEEYVLELSVFHPQASVELGAFGGKDRALHMLTLLSCQSPRFRREVCVRVEL